MECKGIIKDKVCLICGSDKRSEGVTIIGNYICNECIDEITTLGVKDEIYEYIKNKLKGILYR